MIDNNQSLNIDWDRTLRTELEFYNQNQNNPNYYALAWTSLLRKIKKFNHNHNSDLIQKLVNLKKDNTTYFTCCQHIDFKKLIPVFQKLNINTVYASHKIIQENYINDIKIIACPIYAVNIEDNNRNSLIKQQVDKINNFRKYLFSFIGCYHSSYLSTVRKQIFDIESKNDIYIQNNGCNWYFSNIISNNGDYCEKDIELCNHYNKILLSSKFSLCPSGSGPSSIRFWESLGAGTIPVILSDSMDLPSHELWNQTVVRIPEKQVNNIYSILSLLPETEQISRRKNCLKIYNFFRQNYAG
jgi:hypothetical protein